MSDDRAEGSPEVPAEGVRTFLTVDPESRPVRRRRTARVLVVDSGDRMLLFSDSDPGIPDLRWWITPGGGVEPGESDEEAAVREVAEETGLVVERDALLGPLATRHVQHGYTDVVVVQDEVFFGLVVAPFEVDVSRHTEEERITMSSHRWWTREELATTTGTVWPAVILELWDRMVAGGPVLDLGSAEESTVPVGGVT
jgi:8-oxo-dGTP pyrophosphatase MutT (NUDIX family)